MKKTVSLLFGSIILFLGVCCSDDDKNTLTLSHEEVAEMVATTLAESTSGLTAVTDTSARVTTAVLHDGDYCGFTEKKNFNATSHPDANHFYDYDYAYTFLVNCTGTLPQTMSAKLTFTGEYDSKRIASQHTGTGDLVITGLDAAAANYLFNGKYESDGTYESRISDRSEGSNVIIVNVKDLTVRKTDHHILSGSATVTITGHLADNRPYGANATVAFNGDNTCIITVRDFRYSCDLITGYIKGLQ